MRPIYRRAMIRALLGDIEAWDEYTDAIEKLYMVSQLSGWIKVHTGLSRTYRYADITIKPFTKAYNRLMNRIPVPSRVMRKMRTTAKRWAFWITEIDNTRVLQQVKKTIAGAMTGKGVPTIHVIRRALKAEGEKLTDARLETVVRTNVATGFMDGQRDAIKENISLIPLLRLDEIHDNRTRGNPNGLYPSPAHPHYQMDGFIESANNPVWRTIWPPNGYNCRASITPIPWHEAEEMGLVTGKRINQQALAKHNGRRWYYITSGLYPDKGFRGPKSKV